MTLHSNGFKERLRDFVIEQGFISAGFAKADLLKEDIAHYREWIDNGYHATMHYLDKNYDKKEDVRQILPEAKTVMVAAFNYNTAYQHSGYSDVGKISRYAWGDDYHDILKAKLDNVVVFLKEHYPESRSISYVDTGPVLDKIWAVRAGLGWQGKNSLVLSRGFGSWFFIGIIISSIEFEPDSMSKEFCGKCTKCIEACPTSAIVAPKQVDSRKCISYWTIEAKPDIELPAEIVQNQAGWAYGCDICQEVCPWNNGLDIFQEDLRFHPRNGETVLAKSDIMNMEKESFKLRFRNSPIKRTKLEGIRRNFQIKSANEEIYSSLKIL
jgi:epoxyqueuosine reductase